MARAQDLSFGDNLYPTFSFSETYTDTIVYGDFGYEQVADGVLRVNAVVSMKDVVVEDMLAEGNTLEFDVSNLQLSLDFSDAEFVARDPANGIPYNKYTWLLLATNPATGEEFEAGSVVMKYDDRVLILTVAADHAPGTYSIYGTQQAGYDEEEIDVQQVINFSVGPYKVRDAVLYIFGNSSTFDKTVGVGTPDEQEFYGLARVKLNGEIDSGAPKVAITSPTVRQRVTDRPGTVRGTCSDTHGIAAVEVQVLSGWKKPPDDHPWVQATVSFDSWVLGDVNFPVGQVRVRARSIDFNGLVSVIKSVDFTFSDVSDLTVSAAGPSAGRVTSAFFPPVIYAPGQPSPTAVTKHADGDKLVVTAVPGAASVFDGWTSNKTLTPEQLASARLSFRHQPNMTLTANFIVNPFIPVKGRYNGLATGTTPAGNGFLSVTVAPNGTFTGSLKVGAVTLKLKGKFSNTGRYSETIKLRGTNYTVDLTLNVSGTGPEQITGTVTGGDVNVSIGALRAAFDGFVNPSPQAGSYNVIIPPAAGQADDYPVGIGFGRITVSPSGAVRFTGRTGTSPTFNAAARLAAGGAWPFFGALYGRLGSISGIVTFDLANPASDLSGTLDWFKPADVPNIPVYIGGFSGRSDLLGAKFTPPRPGERLFLGASGGAGKFSVNALADGVLPALQATLDATLGTDHKLTVVVPVGQPISDVKVALSPQTGQFFGSFLEGSVASKFAGIIVGGEKLNRAAGFFRRGERTGRVEIVAP